MGNSALSGDADAVAELYELPCTIPNAGALFKKIRSLQKITQFSTAELERLLTENSNANGSRIELAGGVAKLFDNGEVSIADVGCDFDFCRVAGHLQPV